MVVNFPKTAKLFVFAALTLLAGLPAATADVGFLLPNTFHTDERGRISAIASFSDRFPGTEHPLRSDEFHIVQPNGERRTFDNIHKLEQMSVLYAVLDAPGIYRLSSGERLGRKGEASRLNGALVRLGEDGMDAAALPTGAPILTSQTATVSEVYIRHGDAELPATLATSGRLSIRLSAGEKGFQESLPLRVSVSFDGAPLPGAEVVLVAAFSTYTDQPKGFTAVLDENGETEISSDKTGPHVVFVRHIAEAPAGAETDIRSYSTALVFEVFRNED